MLNFAACSPQVKEKTNKPVLHRFLPRLAKQSEALFQEQHSSLDSWPGVEGTFQAKLILLTLKSCKSNSHGVQYC